jgi:SAM-dependent methyltransferase
MRSRHDFLPGAACPVCGGRAFSAQRVLDATLITAWELSPEEAGYIDIQQGTACAGCGANVRSGALAAAILRWAGFGGVLSDFVSTADARALRVLEINEAGTLTPWLARMPGHVLVRYPAFDMTRPTLPAGTFDLVVHSDTLEHVPDPVAGLAACRAMLDRGGACAFTVPTVIGRLTRNRGNLPPSYHGYPGCTDEDQRVHTEFGADAWTYCMASGFSSCEIVSFHYPAGLAYLARAGVQQNRGG